MTKTDIQNRLGRIEAEYEDLLYSFGDEDQEMEQAKTKHAGKMERLDDEEEQLKEMLKSL